MKPKRVLSWNSARAFQEHLAEMQAFRESHPLCWDDGPRTAVLSHPRLLLSDPPVRPETPAGPGTDVFRLPQLLRLNIPRLS